MERVSGGGSLVSALWDEYRHGMDRYMARCRGRVAPWHPRIWRRFHPGQPAPPSGPTFSFPEFVRLVVNGTREFADDPYMAKVGSGVVTPRTAGWPCTGRHSGRSARPAPPPPPHTWW